MKVQPAMELQPVNFQQQREVRPRDARDSTEMKPFLCCFDPVKTKGQSSCGSGQNT